MNDPDRGSREAMHGDLYVHQYSDDRQLGRINRLLNHLKLESIADVLDVGCGTGILAEVLAPRYRTYTGVDFSRAMIREANRRTVERNLQNCEFVCGNAIALMSDRVCVYDAIFMLDISEHVPDQEWASIVKSARSSLKEGGKVYLHTPNLDFFMERLKRRGWLKQFPEHIAVRNPADNLRFFEEAGYSAASYKTIPHYNALKWLHPLSGVPFLGKKMGARLWIVAVK